MTFNVLKPIYTQTGDWHTVRWLVLGQATSMEDAKKHFGGFPVLEALKK